MNNSNKSIRIDYVLTRSDESILRDKRGRTHGESGCMLP